MKAPLEPVRWDGDHLRILDQRELPQRITHLHCREVEQVAVAIETLAVRGAPAIGITAAYGVALGAMRAADAGGDIVRGARAARERLARTRPTAVNLFYALKRADAVMAREPAASLAAALLAEADAVLEEDLETGRRIGAAGMGVLPGAGEVRVLTHCNAGGLATGGWGTALAPVYAASAAGRSVLVYADETRPLLQGSRLTAWELAQAGIPVTVVVDGASATVLARGLVDVVIVGADRVAANGDTANKIGTLGVALAARDAGIPFYVAAPLSTFDPELPSGAGIPIEERGTGEILGGAERPGVAAFNPAFDVTPARLIAGWITERGVLRPPFPAE